MPEDTDTPTIEQTVAIGAPPADICALLSVPQIIPEYWSEMTLIEDDDSDALEYTPPPEAVSPVVTFTLEPRVREGAAPMNVIMTFKGDLDGTIEWSLQDGEGGTTVSAGATITSATPDDSTTTEMPAQSGVELRAAFGDTLSRTLREALISLKQLCEQPSPPASMTATIEIPEIYCPFPDEISPHLEDATAHTQEWAQKMGLIDEPSSKIAILSYFAGRMYPKAPPEILRLCNDWNCWGFLLDDVTDPLGPDEMQHVQQPLLAVLDGEAPGPYQEPLARALADIHHRASARMHPTWSERFVEHHRELFAGFQWEAHNREANTIPDHQAFIRNRQEFCGGKIVFDLTEVAMDSSSLSTDVYQREAVRGLREAVLNVTAWTNGVYSLRRELAADAIHNLIIILRHEHGCSLQEAVTRTCEMIEAETRRFEALSHRLIVASDTDPTLQAYISGLEYAISGNLAWSTESARYGATD